MPDLQKRVPLITETQPKPGSLPTAPAAAAGLSQGSPPVDLLKAGPSVAVDHEPWYHDRFRYANLTSAAKPNAVERGYVYGGIFYPMAPGQLPSDVMPDDDPILDGMGTPPR